MMALGDDRAVLVEQDTADAWVGARAGHPAIVASSSARVIAACSAGLMVIGSSLIGAVTDSGDGGSAACAVPTCVRFPSGLSPSVQEFHLVNR